MANMDYMLFCVIMPKMMSCSVINVNNDEYYQHMAKRDNMHFCVIMDKMMSCCVINFNSDEYYHHG